MKLKKEYIILAAVLMAISLYLVFRKTDRSHYQLPKLPKFSVKEITKLQIQRPGSTIELQKRDNTWYIEPKKYPADTGKVKDILDVIETLTLTVLVSESENYIRYDLGGDKKIGVKAWAGNTLSREFDIGKTASTYQHTFIRLTGDPNVYHARGYFRSKFDKTVDDLRDLTVLSFKKEDIREIQIRKDKETMVISRKEVPEKEDNKQDKAKPSSPAEKKTVVWQTADGKPINQEKLTRLLASLSDYTCDKYIENAKKEDFKDPVLTVVLNGKKEHTLSVFAKPDKEAKDQPAISSQNAYAFLLSDSQVDFIKKIAEEMLKPPEKG